MDLKTANDKDLERIEASIVAACLRGLSWDDDWDNSSDVDSEEAAAGTSGQYTSVSQGD